MLQNVQTIAYHPQQLPELQREQLSQELYALHCQIFTGVAYETFRRYVVFSPAWRTWLFVQCNSAGEKVGYHALHAFQKSFGDRQYIIFRMEAGTLPQYRGRSLTLVQVLAAMVSVWLRFPGRPSYFFASLIHPSSYVLAARYAPSLWPRREHEIPESKLNLIYALADDFGLPRAEASHPLVRVVNWITVETPVATTRRQRSNPDATFFTTMNPGYGHGHGLLTLAPAALPAMIMVCCHILLYWSFPKLMRWLRQGNPSPRPVSVTIPTRRRPVFTAHGNV